MLVTYLLKIYTNDGTFSLLDSEMNALQKIDRSTSTQLSDKIW